jgi:hypothetical protein
MVAEVMLLLVILCCLYHCLNPRAAVSLQQLLLDQRLQAAVLANPTPIAIEECVESSPLHSNRECTAEQLVFKLVIFVVLFAFAILTRCCARLVTQLHLAASEQHPVDRFQLAFTA